MSKIINIGVIGCGEAAQILHIPTLRELSDRFAITALCDASPKVVAGVGALVPGATLYTDASVLLDDRSVDAVVIANPNTYHAPVAIEAMEKGKHVLIEKPMCMTLSEADLLAEAERRTGVTVQVGYMRRHAPAFDEAVALVAPLRGKINFARVHDIIGPNDSFISATVPVIRGSDIPQSVLDRTNSETRAKLTEAIGTDDEQLGRVYSLLLGLSSHDISAMRELIGLPKGVIHANHRRSGHFITAAFDYGDFICQFETGIDAMARFDAHLEVYTPELVVRVDYDTPYIRHQPARLALTSANTQHGVAHSVGHKTRGDSFVIEWTRFHAAIVEGTAHKTTIADAREDLELFAKMMAVMKGD
ncbi:Gfo/Idh/MocA family protein [Rhizobium leguminosarum]|uniref:Gfo/Idh/MocA family protein n=1 Tax=Rhizobium leguminosarum TaxID=384 RepID=UPI00042818DD|nr:Gfo/Idh/MocA family oxidoreductase [Rhizobium leguminosarum]